MTHDPPGTGPRRDLGVARVVGAILIGALAVAGAVAVAGLAGPPTPSVALEAPRFVAVDASGLEHAYEGEWPFVVGGGVAVLDCDEDGRPDVFLAGGAGTAALFRNASRVGGDLRFQRLSSPVTDVPSVTGAYPLDVDGDGRTDLAMLRLGENVLLRGLGDCVFEPANATWGFDGGDAWTTAFSAKWEAGSSLPTLAFGNYVALDDSGQFDGDCSPSVLIRPDPATGIYGSPTPLEPAYCSLSMLFSDWDRSRRVDLRVSNDRHYYRNGEEQLWRVADGEPPRLWTRDEGWRRLQIWGMGIASQDLTGDGRPEVYLTSIGVNMLQTLADDATGPTFRDIGIRSGAAAHRPFAGGDVLQSTAWHAEFQDVNNDSFMDLFVAKGNVDALPDSAIRDPSNLLIGQTDGTFVEGAQSAGIVGYTLGRGAALADFNLDGLLDLVQVNRREPVSVWRNVGLGDGTTPAPMGHWLGLDLVQAGANRDAVGAWIDIRIGDRLVERELTVGGGHAGGQLGWTHVGLGPADRAAVRIQWPDGELGSWLQVRADRFYVIERGAVEAHEWAPPRGPGPGG